MTKVQAIKIEWSRDTPEAWIYIGAGEDRAEILNCLKRGIEKELGDEGFIVEQDGPGLPSPILKIVFWTENTRKLHNIDEVVKKFVKEVRNEDQ